ncbi:MAG: TorF family putative porin [Pseudomonadota bacterium]
MTTKLLSAVGAGVLATAAFGGSAVAQDKLELSANIGATSDYVFRGGSQTLEDPAVQGGFDATYGMFYAGVWASNVDFVDGSGGPGSGDATIEVDLYAGITPSYMGVDFDLGVIYYAYPGAESLGTADLDYVEIKGGASTTIQKFSIGGVLYYSPDYFAETGAALTPELSLGYEFPAVGIFTPSITGFVGATYFEDDVGGVDQDYFYWSAGLELAVENITLDFRYHDTDQEGFCDLDTCDSRFVFTASVSLP